VTEAHLPGQPRDAIAMPAVAPAGLARTLLMSPCTVSDACQALARAAKDKRTAVVLAGGTDWIVDRHLMDVARAENVDLVVDVTAIDELRTVRVEQHDGHRRVVLGGGVTYWMLRTNPRITGSLPMLGRMARDVGAVQIQTRGTLAGNLATASPAADGVAALMALEARITLTSDVGSRTVPIESFFTGYRKTVRAPAELITSIDVRVPQSDAAARWQKVGTRLAQAISKVALASVVEVEAGVVKHARFGMASVGPTTVPLVAVRSVTEGKELAALDRATLDAAVARDIKPIDDVRSTGEYRLHVAKALVWRAIHPEG
jgi:CO/xanthine dehydrogenase FAD-binding subunit